MKNKNRRELEKYWAEQAAKKAKTAKKKQAEPAQATKDSSTGAAQSAADK